MNGYLRLLLGATAVVGVLAGISGAEALREEKERRANERAMQLLEECGMTASSWQKDHLLPAKLFTESRSHAVLSHVSLWSPTTPYGDRTPGAYDERLKMAMRQGLVPLLRECKRLRGVNFSTSSFGDLELEQVSELTNLKSVNLSFTAITEQSSHCWDRFTNLDRASLFNTSIGDETVKAIVRASGHKLRDLTLSGTRMTDEGLREIVQCSPSLKRLWVSRCRITAHGLAGLSGRTGIRELMIDDTGVTEEALDVLCSMPDLVSLGIRGNEGWSPESIAKLKAALPDCRVFR